MTHLMTMLQSTLSISTLLCSTLTTTTVWPRNQSASGSELRQPSSCSYNHVPWKVGKRVWRPNLHAEETVTQKLPYRSYQLSTAASHFIRRDNKSLHPLLPAKAPLLELSLSSTQSMVAPTNTCCRIPESRPVAHVLPPPAAPLPQSARFSLYSASVTCT